MWVKFQKYQRTWRTSDVSKGSLYVMELKNNTAKILERLRRWINDHAD